MSRIEVWKEEEVRSLKQFETIVKQAFASVEDKDTLRTRLVKVKKFLDEYKNVLSYDKTREVIDAYFNGTNSNFLYQMTFNNKALDLQYLYTYLLK